MSSVWKSGRGYLAEFRPLVPRDDGKAHQQRVPKRIWDCAKPLEASIAWAKECEELCSTLVRAPVASHINKARKLGAISEQQATALLKGLPLLANSRRKPVTIEEAFLSHPSSHNDTGRAPARYVDAIVAYITWSKSSALQDLTLDRFTAYRDHLVKEGYAWSSRMHLMLPLRRASRMAAARFGMPDVLSGLRLDKPERRPMAEAWTVEELRTALPKLDIRAKVATALGGFVSLRPSETIRIRCGDLRKDNRLPYAILPGREKEAKNHASRRLLPIPDTLADWMRDLADDRPADDPLLVTIPGNPGERGPNEASQAFTGETFNQWLQPILAEATGRRLPVKCLRKTFSTWTRKQKLDPEHREVYMGHETELAQSITGQHYIADLYEVLADELMPTCRKIEKALHAQTRGRKPKQAQGHAV